jgi:hypothetical protein
MKLSSASFYITYDGKISGSVTFRGEKNQVTHELTDAQVAEFELMVLRWQGAVLDESAAQLIQARDDLLAIEHSAAPLEE